MAAEKAIAENAATGVAKVSGMAQIAANQRNGAKSRGPPNQEGKARSRMNASPRFGRGVDVCAKSKLNASRFSMMYIIRRHPTISTNSIRL